MFSASRGPFEDMDERGPSAQFPPDEAFAGPPESLAGSVLGELEGESPLENSTIDVVGRTAASNVPSPSHPPLQQASLFYLSLIEGRCRTQAANLVNGRRHPEDQLPEDHSDICKVAEILFAEMSKELLRAGLLPRQVAVPTFHELRRYLASFDTTLNNIAIKQPPGTFDDSIYRAIDSPNTFSFNSSAASSLFERSHPQSQSELRSLSQSQALIARPFAMPPINQPQVGSQSSLRSVIFSKGQDKQLQTCLYNMKFRQLCHLGKGGFGNVYSVLHLLDGQEYAVKKIPIFVNRLDSILHNEIQATELLSELRALAKLQHRNVVRYFDSWVEFASAPRRTTDDGQKRLDSRAYASEEESTDTDSESDILSSNSSDKSASDFENLRATQEDELKREDKKARKDHKQDWTSTSNVVFEDPSLSTSDVAHQRHKISPSQSTYKSNIFRKPTDDDSDDEEPEEDSTSAEAQGSKGLTIFIQMAKYPMTLEEFIWPSLEKYDTTVKPAHCFHTAPTVRIILSLLDGIEYIHSQHIVHRDLKPLNIFLTVSRSREKLEGSIELHECPECDSSSSTESFSIIPHIGDFGLIAKLDEPSSTQPSQPGFRPSPLALFSSKASTRAVGTKLYCAPRSVSNTICPKLDIYSLGVIALELTVKFGTKNERCEVLGNISKGSLDMSELTGHPLASGIRGMLCTEVGERWGGGQVREWLLGVLGG